MTVETSQNNIAIAKKLFFYTLTIALCSVNGHLKTTKPHSLTNAGKFCSGAKIVLEDVILHGG